MKKRITIKDVAREAEVSIATVSYVINNKESLPKETIEKVNSVIKRLNYVPNLSARSLVSSKSNLIGLVIPQTESGNHLMFNNPFYSEFISGAEYTARLNGYHIIISGADADESYLEVCKKRNMDGIVILGAYPEEFFSNLKKSNIPIVLVDSYCEDYYFHSIQINDRYGGYIATKYLIEKGHKHIALVTGKIKKEGVTEKRYLGYRDALKEFNIPFNQEYIFEGIVDYDYGLGIGGKIIDTSEEITAIFATADILAMGLIRGLKALGKKIPEDISIIGFDDVYTTKLVDPPLTTVKQNIFAKGESAIKLLIKCVNKNLKSKQEIILPIEIVERETVKLYKDEK
jgi:LacI family transcriptional regulator